MRDYRWINSAKSFDVALPRSISAPLERESEMLLNKMITAVDLHACGEPGRVITGGILDVPGKTMFEKMKYFEKHHDDLRLRMLREPRGYPALCCNVIMPPTQKEAAAGFIIMEQTEYPPMSGTNTICVV